MQLRPSKEAKSITSRVSADKSARGGWVTSLMTTDDKGQGLDSGTVNILFGLQIIFAKSMFDESCLTD